MVIVGFQKLWLLLYRHAWMKVYLQICVSLTSLDRYPSLDLSASGTTYGSRQELLFLNLLDKLFVLNLK